MRKLWRGVTPLALMTWTLSAGAPAMRSEVKAYEKPVTMPTWEIGPAQIHPLFPDSGRDIYPYTLNETLTDRKVEKTYRGVFLENEYVKILILPEIGGRLHGAIDKTNGYVWLYWQKTIKPGLISMTGAWISGGIEWNFPHGHRPSCFMPVDYRIVKNPDGSATVWVGETEPIFRMRWLVGMTLYPGRSYLRCDYIFINPTNHRHSFMFWATSATHANEYAQAQYPGDMVTGHGKHQFWNWPIHDGVDMTWWKNVPNASSFFAFNNPSDWFGTYDHRAQGGMVHVANHHIMPGKKLWTWGSGPSGRIWEDILSDGGGPYFEPQAGAWSDNQPDYHWMSPIEVKTTHDYWYPVRDIRGFRNATKDFAVNTELQDGKAFAGVYATAPVTGYRVVLEDVKRGRVLSDAVVSIAPDKPYTVEAPAPEGATVYDLRLSVRDMQGNEVISLQRRPPKKVELPEGLKEPGDPKKMKPDALYHAGEWLERFRRVPEAMTYYEEALRRDSGDSRVNAALGFLALKQGRWKEALGRIRTALKRDSDNTSLYFGAALAALGLGDEDRAYDEFYRATYSYEDFSVSYYNLARLDLRRGRYREAVEKLDEAAAHNRRFAGIAALKAAALRKLGELDAAERAARQALALDPMHFMGGYELALALRRKGEAAEWEKTWRSYMRDEPQNYMELASAYAAAGLYGDAGAVLDLYAEGRTAEKTHPMVNYYRGYYRELSGDAAAAEKFYRDAARGPVAYTNPHRIEAVAALEAAIRRNPSDSHAHLFLGNVLYAKGRREEGFEHWKKAADLEPGLVFAWRNLGYGYRHLKKDLRKAYEAYRQAAKVSPTDARVLLEMDEVAEQLGIAPEKRLAFLDAHKEAAETRDDLIGRMVDLRLELGDTPNLKAAYEMLRDHHFHSWEGRYDIHHAWVEVNTRLGELAMQEKDYQTALEYFQRATEYPANLEVAPRTPDFRAHVYWNLARVKLAMGKREEAEELLRKILAEDYSKPHLGYYYQALAAKQLGDRERYRKLLDALEKEARKRTSGAFEYRGTPETIGHYLLSLVLKEKGDAEGAARELKLALAQNPRAARLAVHEAQLDTAKAHQ